MSESEPEEKEKRAPLNPRGDCELCGVKLSKRAMLGHLAGCAFGADPTKGAMVVQLRVDVPRTDYWLDLDVLAHASLRDLDRFLRAIWLECCSHLSEFTIGTAHYAAIVDREFGAPHERSMNARISTALRNAGKDFSYEYDFGSTTRLRLTPVADRYAASRKAPVRLLARNDAPVWPCTVCGSEAASIYCNYDGESAFVCAAHEAEHEYSEETMLPVVNSPRMGVCGYTG